MTYIDGGDSFKLPVLLNKSGSLCAENLFDSSAWQLDCSIGSGRRTSIVVASFELASLLESAVRTTFSLGVA